jgi:hypothetical protein
MRSCFEKSGMSGFSKRKAARRKSEGMKNTRLDQKRFSWVKLVLVVGHLAIIAGLAVSASANRRTRLPGPLRGIAGSFQVDGEGGPLR